MSHRQKLGRAKSHIEHVEQMVRLWARDGCEIVEEADGKRGTEIFVEKVKPLPDDLPLVIGDALQNLRNSLDNLAFSLALKNKGALTPEQEEHICFPIKDFPPRTQDMKLMSCAVRQDIRAVAPDPVRHPLNDDLLWLLNKTANRDKHRRLHTTVAGLASVQPSVSADFVDEMELGPPGSFTLKEGRVPIARFGPASSNVHYQVSTTLHVLFDGPIEVEGREVIMTLRRFHDHIRDVVFQALEPHL